MATIEEMAKEKLEGMEKDEIKKLLSKSRYSWNRSQAETIKTDSLMRDEIELVNSDEEIIKLLVEQEVIKERINQRFDEILKESRGVPFQVSSRGLRINMGDYDWEQLTEEVEKANWQIIPYHADGIAYLNPIFVSKTASHSLHEILPALEKCLEVRK